MLPASVLLSACIIGTVPECSETKQDSADLVFNGENKVGPNQLVFSADTGTEKVPGVCNEPRWTLSFDPACLAESMKCTVIIPVKTLDTGNARHNEIMTSAQWLDMKRYPEIRFELKKVKKATVVSLTEKELECVGEVTMRGLTQTVQVPFRFVHLPESPATKKRAPGQLLFMSGEFQVPLSAFGADAPQGRFVDIKARLFGSTVRSTGKPGGAPKSPPSDKGTAEPPDKPEAADDQPTPTGSRSPGQSPL